MWFASPPGQALINRVGVFRRLQGIDIGQHIIDMVVYSPRFRTVADRQKVRCHQEPAEIPPSKAVVEHRMLLLQQPPGRSIGWDHRPRYIDHRGLAPTQRLRIAMRVNAQWLHPRCPIPRIVLSSRRPSLRQPTSHTSSYHTRGHRLVDSTPHTRTPSGPEPRGHARVRPTDDQPNLPYPYRSRNTLPRRKA